MAYLDESGVTSLTSDIKALADNAYAAKNHTHSNATTSAAGLMSAADKTKLDGLTGVVVADTEPTGNVLTWIDPDSGSTNVIPQIDDTQTSSSDTYSSQKIHASYLCFSASQTLTEGQMSQLYANMGFPSNTAGKLGYTVVT